METAVVKEQERIKRNKDENEIENKTHLVLAEKTHLRDELTNHHLLHGHHDHSHAICGRGKERGRSSAKESDSSRRVFELTLIHSRAVVGVDHSVRVQATNSYDWWSSGS